MLCHMFPTVSMWTSAWNSKHTLSLSFVTAINMTYAQNRIAFVTLFAIPMQEDFSSTSPQRQTFATVQKLCICYVFSFVNSHFTLFTYQNSVSCTRTRSIFGWKLEWSLSLSRFSELLKEMLICFWNTNVMINNDAAMTQRSQYWLHCLRNSTTIVYCSHLYVNLGG